MFVIVYSHLYKYTHTQYKWEDSKNINILKKEINLKQGARTIEKSLRGFVITVIG